MKGSELSPGSGKKNIFVRDAEKTIGGMNDTGFPPVFLEISSFSLR